MPRLIVYAGPNGSGKSTLRDIANDPVDVAIDPDRIATSLAAGENTDIKAAKEAIRWFREALAKGFSISLESTLTGATILARMAAAKQSGYRVSLVYVALTTVEDNITRVAARVTKGGHAIPEDVIRRRVAASHENLLAALTLADDGSVIDNAGLTHRTLLVFEARRLIYEDSSLPHWLRVRMPAIRNALRAGA